MSTIAAFTAGRGDEFPLYATRRGARRIPLTIRPRVPVSQTGPRNRQLEKRPAERPVPRTLARQCCAFGSSRQAVPCYPRIQNISFEAALWTSELKPVSVDGVYGRNPSAPVFGPHLGWTNVRVPRDTDGTAPQLRRSPFTARRRPDNRWLCRSSVGSQRQRAASRRQSNPSGVNRRGPGAGIVGHSYRAAATAQNIDPVKSRSGDGSSCASLVKNRGPLMLSGGDFVGH